MGDSTITYLRKLIGPFKTHSVPLVIFINTTKDAISELNKRSDILTFFFILYCISKCLSVYSRHLYVTSAWNRTQDKPVDKTIKQQS